MYDLRFIDTMEILMKTRFNSFIRIVNFKSTLFFSLLTIPFFAACSSNSVRQSSIPQKTVRNIEQSATDPAGFAGRTSLDGTTMPASESVRILSSHGGITEFTAYGEGSALPNEAPRLAQDRAEKDALSKAIRKTGVNVSAGMFDFATENALTSSQMVSSYANVWSEAVSQYETVGDPDCKFIATRGTYCKVHIKGKVSKKGDPDPDFKILKASLNQPAFYDGDELNLTLKVSQDCYITLLNIDADGNITMVFPNGYSKKSFVKAGQTVNIPGDYNFNLNPSLPEGSRETAEILHIIATKKRPFLPGGTYNNDNPFEAYPAGKLSDMAARLAEFPRDEWTATILPYGIKAR